jgi:peptidyl-dipeptidase Dcp
MKNFILLFAFAALFYCAQSSNPLLQHFETPFNVPPFDEIKESHFMPAYKTAIAEHQKEIKAIVSNPETPDFENTLAVLDSSGLLLDRVDNIFSNLNSAHTNDKMQEIAKKSAPMLSKHRDEIILNQQLFERIEHVYQQRHELNLNEEETMLLQETYKEFVRNGANLNDAQKDSLKKMNEELSLLSIQFGENVLAATNAFELVIEDETDLSGLPAGVIEAAGEAAEERGHLGKWVFTLHKPSLIPFLQYAQNRALREELFKAYINRCENGSDYDNTAIVSRMAFLRVKRAQLLGYPTHADFVLEENMAKNPENVYDLLQQLWDQALPVAKMERRQFKNMIEQEGSDFSLQPWDWWYYAEKVKKARYDLDETSLRPYFQLENVIDGAFMVANKLWGIVLEERDDLPVYHPDVRTFEVKEADGSHIGILYVDYFPRASKRGGAWMSAYRKQWKKNGQMVSPVICNVGNFSKPTAENPSLLSVDEVLTLFHEFGHALHGLLSDCTFRSLSGTSVALDFVELPSQIMENWATHPVVIKMYAKHHQSGEPIPDDFIEKIQKSNHFNQGFVTVELLSASFLDMDWHTITDVQSPKPQSFEEKSMQKIGLIPEIVVRYKSPYFRHIFSGGYSAGYYSYTWAAVLDADAFEAFRQNGIFDQGTAQRFRRHILSAGGTAEPMTLYKRFRGAEPSIRALLERKGFTKAL